MNNNNYNEFINKLDKVPKLPDTIYNSVFKKRTRKITIIKFIKASPAIAALIIFAFIFITRENEIENLHISSNYEVQELVIEDDYDNFDDYYPLFNL